MILNTGSRTDIPAFYSDWFVNRIREGYVLARNPYAPSQVTRYRLTPKVIDILTFCTKILSLCWIGCGNYQNIPACGT